MSQNVKFYFGSQAKYDALSTKNPLALYFIEDTQRLYKGEVLLATGAEASAQYTGLMSAEDKAKFDALIAEGSGIANLTPIDGSIVITDVNKGKAIGVAISSKEGNALVAVEGGLFVPVAQEVSMPEYSIEKQEIAEDGYAVSYKLKKTIDGASSYVGDAINIAKDMVLKGATLETVVEANVPYAGAVVGDPYIDMEFNDAVKSHIYVPVKGLVDSYTAGDGIEIVDGKISVKIASESHGLVAVDGGMAMVLATAEQDGAMSKEDKVFIDSIPATYASINRVEKTAMQIKYEIVSKPEGTLVNYGENEIRVMCPADTKWIKQGVGSTGNANMYYMGFRAYAPKGAVSFKEGDRGVIVDEMFDFNGDFAGTDEFGRNFSIVWLALALYDEASDTWTYFGKNSNAEKYIGWDYVVEWFDESGVKIASDSIRINLSNESCHNIDTPYYISALEAKVDAMNESYVWGEL